MLLTRFLLHRVLSWVIGVAEKREVCSAGNLGSGENVPEGKWFDRIPSALEFCFLGANLPEGTGHKMTCLLIPKSCVTAPT